MAINSVPKTLTAASATAAWLAVAALIAPAAPLSARETATPAACQAAAVSRPIVDATAALAEAPKDPRANAALADAWSDAGCFNDAVQVLQRAVADNPGNEELATRLRVARSLVGEAHFFDDLDRASAEARLKRDSFRCANLSDLEACSDALRMKPDDPGLLVLQGDALLRAKRPADAISRYRLAALLAPDQHDVGAKIAAAEGELPPPADVAAAPPEPPGDLVSAAAADAPLRAAIGGSETAPARRYSNLEPETRSH